jgi:hypothetical protein
MMGFAGSIPAIGVIREPKVRGVVLGILPNFFVGNKYPSFEIRSALETEGP